MLSIIHKKAYQEFLNLLQEFLDKLKGSDKTIFQKSWHDLQQFCHQKIFTLTGDDLDESIIQQWRSLQTEIQREFRLLNTDMSFFAASRQTKTKEIRLKSIRDRVNRLAQFSTMAKDLIEVMGNRE